MRLTIAVVFLVGAVSLASANFQQKASSTLYTYVCQDKRCLRKLKADSGEAEVSINVCKLTCDDLGSLWPKPTGQVLLGKELVSLYPSNITLDTVHPNPNVQAMVKTSFEIFQSYILMLSDQPISETGAALQNKLGVRITVASNTTDLALSVDESYNLTISSSSAGNNETVIATITANTFFGARHALETLSQLIAYDEVNDVLKIVKNATVSDKPVFPYRGVMLDTSRSYFSVDNIKKLIDGLSYNKMSVFHWHITDSYSFPMELPNLPQMTEYGVYSPSKIYTAEKIKEVVSYAKQRGIKVIPELDQPAHSGYGYQWGGKENKGELVVCVESEPWYDYCVQPPCGQLNIVNDNVTELIGQIFTGMLSMFDKDIFHMGGDEVDFRCYNSTKEITGWMVANNYPLTEDGFFRLWGEFQEKALQKLLTASGVDTQILLWTSGLTHPDRIEAHLNKSRYIIQIWSESTDPIISGLLQKGYRTIFSNVDALYLDCGFQAWLGDGHNWCSPIKGWQTVYDNDPEKIYAKFTNDTVAGEAVKNGQILGSETPLWAEQVDDQALGSRIFPRAAAHAERLWSHPETGHSEAEVRMVTNRDRMVRRGIAADSIQPEFCLQNEGKCYAYRPPGPEETTTTGKSGGGGGGGGGGGDGDKNGANGNLINTALTLTFGTTTAMLLLALTNLI